MQSGRFDLAQAEFIETLKLDAGDADVSYSLGVVILKLKQKNSLALFHFARAAAYQGVGALSPNHPLNVRQFTVMAFERSHGYDPETLAKLFDLAKRQPFPPDEFTIAKLRIN